MLFFSFFKTLVDQEVTVELKNDIQIRGTLKSVDQYLNIKLDDISVVEEIKYPHLVSMEPAPDYAPAFVRQERIHQRKCGEICPPTRRRRGYPVTRGRNEKRSCPTSIESESSINEVMGDDFGEGIRKRHVATAATA
ncbi:hypothetical protein V500_05316 [Pseudogymnoascus sp. VKM F-4518 (FW-2643)]|nr:hypothetical protein V500_05316 [Pseudogymnoascus sp. VKM F-4518 (FW-2643)]